MTRLMKWPFWNQEHQDAIFWSGMRRLALSSIQAGIHASLNFSSEGLIPPMSCGCVKELRKPPVHTKETWWWLVEIKTPYKNSLEKTIFLGLEPPSMVISLLTLIIEEACIKAHTLKPQINVVWAALICGFTNCWFKVPWRITNEGVSEANDRLEVEFDRLAWIEEPMASRIWSWTTGIEAVHTSISDYLRC